MAGDKQDAAYLWDMLDAARTVRNMTEGVGKPAREVPPGVLNSVLKQAGLK